MLCELDNVYNLPEGPILWGSPTESDLTLHNSLVDIIKVMLSST